MKDLQLERTTMIAVHSISMTERYLPPTEKTIKAMAESFNKIGQLSPIVVHPVTRNTYRIVAGATRFKAASSLGWTKIRADIVSGPASAYRVHEIAENLERRDLSKEQRRHARAEMKRLLGEMLASAEPAKGGRGKKGGIREAARKAGVPKSTAHDQKKLSGNTDTRTVSEPQSSEPQAAQKNGSRARETVRKKHSISFTEMEWQMIDKYRKEVCQGGSFSDCVRALIRDALAAQDRHIMTKKEIEEAA